MWRETGRKSLEQWLQKLEAQLDLEPLMEGCCQALLELTGANRCSIMVLDSDTDQLVVRWAYGTRVKPQGGGLKFRVGEGLCGWVARSQKAFCSVDASKEPRFVPRGSQQGRRFQEVKAICCVPLVMGGRTVGVINLSSFSPSRRFRWVNSSQAKRFLDRLAHVISQATLLHEAQAITQRLRRQAKMTSETVAQVSHEVRTPLTVITEASQQLLDGFGGRLASEQEELARVIKAQAERMLGLVTELLDLSRIEAGRLSLRREPIDLAEVLRDVRGRYTLLVQPRQLHLEIASVSPVYGDRTRLTQVLENLLANAVKFTPSDGSITIHLSSKGRCAELAISDTGIGIAPREQRRLFEKFSQLRVPVNLNARGTGLGLAIVREIVHLHGGTVRVESKQGKGATFIVSLPFYTPSFALTEEFRVMRSQAAHEGRTLVVQLLEPKPHRTLQVKKVLEILRQQVSREDRVLENPAGGIIALSVLDPEGFPALRRRISEVLSAHPECVSVSDLSWGWAFVPREETTLPGVLQLAKKRACEEGREVAKL